MELDRKYQLEILKSLAESYPRSWDNRRELNGMDEAALNKYAANVLYHEEHGLVEANIQIGIDGYISCGTQKITARGMDFLADDGGLSAILGVVTVRLHADTVKELLVERINASNLPETEKSALRKHLESLSGEAWKEAGRYLIAEGLHHLPNAIEWLRKLVSLA